MKGQLIVCYVYSESEETKTVVYTAADMESMLSMNAGDHWRLNSNRPEGDKITWTISERTFEISTDPSTGETHLSQLRLVLTA